MASKNTVTTDNLAALGAERLAAILVELAADHATIKRRLRLELAGEAGGDAIAAQIGKRLAALRSARSFIDWEKRRDFVRDLDLQRTMIADRLAQTRPDLALDLMWRFMALAEPVLNRVDDSSGSVSGVFRTACAHLGPLATKAKPDPEHLAERIFAAVTTNDYGQFDGLVPAIFPALGEAGIASLKARLTAALAARPRTDRYDSQASALRRASQDLADAEGNIDAYIALVPTQARTQPGIAAQIGTRLLAADRAEEALAMLEAATPKKHTRHSTLDDDAFELGWQGPSADWEGVHIDALVATGQVERAQQARLAAFEEHLSVEHLRAYLKTLPDFDDVVAEERAMEYALGFRSFPVALYFFHEWPAPRQAAQLVLTRHTDVDGNMYYLLDPAARWLEGTHPLAATLLRRAMIEDTLDGAKSKRYRHAARHLAECRSLASLISDYGSFGTHEAFAARLRIKHGRKAGFWSHVAETSGAQA